MDVLPLIENPELRKSIEELRAHIQSPEHCISDILDNSGNQYIDLVMEGGGMLGIALVGYTWALEEMGIRFMGVGGTSAGSINALLLASLDEPAKPKSPRLLNELANQDFYDFVDGGDNVRDLIELALGGEKSFKGLRMIYRAMKVKRKLCREYGLNEGDAFQSWLRGLLSGVGIDTLKDLENRLATAPPGLHRRDRKPFAESECPSGKLAIITADITTETRVELPRMASLYWSNPEAQNPAAFARASMAIPFFFEPLRVSGIPNDAEASKRWVELAGYAVGQDPTAVIPDTALFVDGGIMSNFPIDAFHQHNHVPSMPTFGVKLEYDQRYKSPKKFPIKGSGRIKALMPVAGSVFNSSRHTLDYEFVKKNPDYRHLVQYIPCTYEDREGVTRSYNWLDFNMSDAHKKGLFIQGAQKAIEFVRTFSSPYGKFSSKWQYYKHFRQQLLEPETTDEVARKPEVTELEPA